MNADPKWLDDAIEAACEVTWEDHMAGYDWYWPWTEAGEIADKSWRYSVSMTIRAALPVIREGLAKEIRALIEPGHVYTFREGLEAAAMIVTGEES